MRIRNGCMLCISITALLLTGCQLNEVRGKNQFGTEWRHSGSSDTDRERYTVKQGFDFKWSNGVNTGISYRRRDDNDGSGDNDNGMFIDISYPLWKRPKEPNPQAAKIAELERRLARLEQQRSGTGSSTTK